MAWFRAKYGIGEDTIASLKIGYGDNDEPSIVRLLLDEPGAFTMRELAGIRLTRRLFGSGIPFDLLVLTPEEVEERLRRNGPFIQEILSTGQVVYQRT